jgi:hypothetical protein
VSARKIYWGPPLLSAPVNNTPPLPGKLGAICDGSSSYNQTSGNSLRKIINQITTYSWYAQVIPMIPVSRTKIGCGWGDE